MIERLIREVRIRTALDTGGLEDAVLLVGAGRSGTTWLSDLLSRGAGKRLLFEPLNPNKVPLVKHFAPRQYIRPGDQSSQWVEPMEKIIRGKMRSRWTCRHNDQWISRGRIIKVIRANLLLSWLYNQFPQVKIVFVMRNPCAVALSRLQLGWLTLLDTLLEQSELMEDWLEPFRLRMETASTPFQKHTVLWAIEHHVPLRAMVGKGMYVASYESFCQQPGQSFERLIRFLDCEFDYRVLRDVDRPSRVTPENSAIYTGKNLISSWKTKISPEQWTYVNETLEEFGLLGFYDQNGDYVYPGETV